MVTMSVEDPGADSLLLPGAVGAVGAMGAVGALTPARLAPGQPITKPVSWDFFFLSR